MAMTRVYGSFFCGLQRVARRLWLCYPVFTALTATATIGVPLGEPEYVAQQADTMPAILVALVGGSAGAYALQIWSRWAQDVNTGTTDALPNVYVLCTTPGLEESIAAVPHVQPFRVDGTSSWAAVLENFVSTHDNKLMGVGLLGEGALPHPGLTKSVESISQPLHQARQPTAILTRSRSRGIDPAGNHWLSDKFVSQIWCNRAMLERWRLARAGLETWKVENLSLLDAIAILIRSNQGFAIDEQHFLVDGTKVVPSFFAQASSIGFEVGKYPGWSGMPTTTPGSVKNEVDVNIGRLDLGLVTDCDDGSGDGGPPRGVSPLENLLKAKSPDEATGTSGVCSSVGRSSRIARAPWPPEYILDTAVVKGSTSGTSKGLVVVNNVNCGYLDMATNFWRSVQKATGGDAKVR